MMYAIAVIQLDMTSAILSCNHHDCPQSNPLSFPCSFTAKSNKESNGGRGRWRLIMRLWLQEASGVLIAFWINQVYLG